MLGALGLAPRLGGRPPLELHLRAREVSPRGELGGSRARPGPRGGHASQRLRGAPTPSQRPERRQRRQRGRQLRGQLPRSSARSRGGCEGCCCGWPRPPPLSPYRTRGTGLCLALHPGDFTAPLVPGGAEAGKSVPHPIGEGREEVRGPAAAERRREGGGEQAQSGRGGAPRSSVAHSRGQRAQAPPLTARPSSPRCTHTDAASAKHDGGRRRPRSPPGRGGDERSHSQARRRPAHTAGPAAGPSPRASPPSPRLHAPL